MEPNHRRSALEIISEILGLGEATKTQIMYGSNMSYSQIQRYLEFLWTEVSWSAWSSPTPA